MSDKVKTKTNMDELYAESLMFQSPDPVHLPIPVFDKFGKFKNGPWPKTQDVDQLQDIQDLENKSLITN